MTVPHASEEYRCRHCEINLSFMDIKDKWLCPSCSQPVSIKVDIGGRWQDCERLHPADITAGDIVTIDREMTHRVLNITPQNDHFRVALEKHGVERYAKNDYLLVMKGAWYPW